MNTPSVGLQEKSKAPLFLHRQQHWKQAFVGVCNVCVFLPITLYFYSPTPGTPSVRAESSSQRVTCSVVANTRRGKCLACRMPNTHIDPKNRMHTAAQITPLVLLWTASKIPLPFPQGILLIVYNILGVEKWRRRLRRTIRTRPSRSYTLRSLRAVFFQDISEFSGIFFWHFLSSRFFWFVFPNNK